LQKFIKHIPMINNVCIRTYANLELINHCKKMLAEGEDSIQRLSTVLSLAGNAVRLKILYLLQEEKELCVCDLSDVLNMKIPAVSQHLRKLKDGNILDVRKFGTTYYYFIKKENLEVLKPVFQLIHSQEIEPTV